MCFWDRFLLSLFKIVKIIKHKAMPDESETKIDTIGGLCARKPLIKNARAAPASDGAAYSNCVLTWSKW